jgi:hypothetical protein
MSLIPQHLNYVSNPYDFLLNNKGLRSDDDDDDDDDDDRNCQDMGKFPF